MKHITLTFLSLLYLVGVHGQKIVRSDLDHFWEAYDKITSTQNDSLQRHYLDALFLSQASEGQKILMREVWDFRPNNILNAIRRYPSFWSCFRNNALILNGLELELAREIDKLHTLYPAFKPATFYFAVGDFREKSVSQGQSVVMAAETFFCEEDSVPGQFTINYADYGNPAFGANPREYIVQLCIREYIHTQQKPRDKSLLSRCLYEGVAEFMAVLATGKPSPTRAFDNGKENETRLKIRFEKDLFLGGDNNWLSNSNINEFKIALLGHYIGYAICEKYYEAATDKKMAIRQMMRVNYTDNDNVEKPVDASHYLFAPIAVLRSRFNFEAPRVVHIDEFENKSQDVNPAITRITLRFSMPLNKEYSGLSYGPWGKTRIPPVVEFIGFSDDGKSATIAVRFEPGQKYQLLITNNFESMSGVPLIPLLIDIKTAEK